MVSIEQKSWNKYVKTTLYLGMKLGRKDQGRGVTNTGSFKDEL
jgi:hypothetical protein